jgi:hypothetical protein
MRTTTGSILFALGLAACGPGPQPPPRPVQNAHDAPEPGPAPSSPPVGGRAPEAGEVALLGGRLVARLPEGAAVQARQRSIMSAEESAEEETRVVVEPGPRSARFVMLVSERFQSSTGDVAADARALVGDERAGADLAPASTGAGLSASWMTPTNPSASGGALLVKRALVRLPDATLVSIAFYVLPEMSAEAGAYRSKAERILASVAAGARRLELRTNLALDAGDGSTLHVAMPEGCVVTAQRGHDFLVYRARPVRKIGAPQAWLGVYFGGHPAFQHDQSDDRPVVTKAPATFLGQATEWHEWGEGASRVAEILVRTPRSRAVHLWVVGDATSGASFRKAAEAATLK